jgi:hypothetical protein
MGEGLLYGLPEPPARVLLRVVTEPSPQPGVRIGQGLAGGLMALGGPVLPGHPAGEPFTHTHHRDEVVDGRPPACRAQKFPVMMTLVAGDGPDPQVSWPMLVPFVGPVDPSPANRRTKIIVSFAGAV